MTEPWQLTVDTLRWSFLTNHARGLVCLAKDPEMRLRDLAQALEISERCAFTIVNDLVAAGYIVKERSGRRNRYCIENTALLREPIGGEQSIGELLSLLVDSGSSMSDAVP